MQPPAPARLEVLEALVSVQGGGGAEDTNGQSHHGELPRRRRTAERLPCRAFNSSTGRILDQFKSHQQILTALLQLWATNSTKIVAF